MLLELARRGPLSSGQIAKLVGINRSHAFAILRDFQTMGLITREGQRSKAVLNEDFFAFPELVTLLHALGGRRVLAIRDPKVATPPSPRSLLKLFGTPDRTRVLIGLAAAQSANINRMAGIAGVSPRAALDVVRHFESQGVLRSVHVEIERIVEFNPDFRFQELLLALLRRVGDAFPALVQAARYHNKRMKERGAELRANPQPGFRPGFMPFGEEVQAHVLFELARRGPLTTSGLAALTGKSVNCPRSAMLSLQEYGLIVTCIHGRGHSRKRWAALNPQHPLSERLRAYVRDLFPEEPPLLRMPPPGFPQSCQPPPIQRKLPGHWLRIACMLAVFAKPGTGVPEIAHLLNQHSHKPIRTWIEDLHAHELIDYGPTGARMIAAPNPRFRAAATLQNLIEAMEGFLLADIR